MIINNCNFKKEIGIENQKLCKQVKDQRNGTKVFLFLNQAHAGTDRRTPGFLELLLSTNVCMRVCLCVHVRVCVCPPPRLLITSGVI